MNHRELHIPSHIRIASFISFYETPVNGLRLVRASVTNRIGVLDQASIVSTQAYGEQYISDILEEVGPFPSFALLTPNIDKSDDTVTSLERGFCHSCRLSTAVHNITIIRNIFRLPKSR